MERIVQPEDCLRGGGEMGALMRSHDWSQTLLGKVADWPAPLRIAVSICLNSRFPMVIWWGKELILLYNDAWRPVLGTSKHPQALGRPGREIWSEIWDIIGVQLESVLSTGQATWSDDMLLMVDRHGYKEEAYFTYSYSPILVETGEVGGAFTAVSETTQRVLGERRLQTLRDLAARAGEAKTAEQASLMAIQTLAANPADIPFALLYLLQADGTQLLLAGSTPLESGTPASPVEVDLTIANSDSTSSWPLATAVSTGSAVLVEDLLTRFGMLPTGQWEIQPRQALVLPLRAVGQELPAGLLVAGVNPCRILDDDYRNFFEMTAGHIATALANARAYEEERFRSEALAELDRAKTTFFSNVSHEFRTPLTLMLGPLEDIIAGEANALPDNQQQQLEMVHRNGLRLLKLVNTLLDFSRIEAGRVRAVYEPTDLAAFTAELGSVFRSAVERAGLSLVVDCPPLPDLIYIDRDMWEKIVLNLLSNAFKFTFSGEIAVRMRFNSPDSVELVVQDTGTGIPAEELPRLFERFHRVEGARGRTHEGSGIGLALVYELVRLHGGSIQVESVVGSGTTFTVRVPTGKAHLPLDRISTASTLVSTALGAAPYVEEALRWLPEEAFPGSARERGHSQALPGNELAQEESRQLPISRSQSPISSTARILLADDNADMRDYLQRLLRERYEVEAVADGIAALAAARRQTPDLVLSDVMMPGLDGFGLLKELRAMPDTREIPIILLSARAGEESRIEGLEAGADDYLVKPFSARELLARVAANLELAIVRREAANIERLARAEAEAAREQVSNILESISDAFFFLDNEWRYVYVNQEAERQVRKQQEELMGKDIWEVFPDIVDSAFYREYHRAVREQVSVAFEEFYAPYNCWYEVHAYPSKNGLSVYFQNITQRKQLEEELKRQAEQLAEANRMKDEFLAIVSHELRSPLNSMLGWAQMLRSRNLNPAMTAKALETIERNARSQTQLIEDLLDVSRIITGKLRLNVRLIELAPIVEAAIDSVRPAADAKQIRLQVVLDPMAAPVSGDSERLQQVIWNLLSNAVKFTPKGGRVYVLLERINSHIEITVSDTGIGINPEFLPFVFERFRQADATTTRAHGGLGLGLAIVRHLLELHGGTIRVASPGEGQGSTFTVSLPLPPVRLSVNDSERIHPTVSPGVRFDNSPSLEGLRVLVVDDEVDTREFLIVALQECGATVRAAASAREALEAIEQWKPDVLVSDIGMPEEDGYALIRQVRSSDSARGKILPAAALTAYARSEDRMRALKEGFQMHLSKPVEPAELATVVASLARRIGKI